MINVSELIKDSYNILRKEKLIWIIAFVIGLVSLIPDLLPAQNLLIRDKNIEFFLLNLLVIFVSLYLVVMMFTVISMAIQRKLKNKSMILKQTNHFFWRYLGLSVLIGIAVMVLMMITALILTLLMIMIISVSGAGSLTINDYSSILVYWLVIFPVVVIPMFLLLYLKFSLAIPIMFLDDRKAIDSLKDSCSKSKGHVVDILLIGMILLIIAVVGLVPVMGVELLILKGYQPNIVITVLSSVFSVVTLPVFMTFAQIFYFNGCLAIKKIK
ncbi:MAG: hypothetical protein AABW49_04870 [Nanoarchaeota archaeon]